MSVLRAAEAAPPPPGLAPFPRLGHYAQGGWGPVGLDARGGLFARLDLLAKYHYVIIGTWPVWQYNDDDGGPFYLKDLPNMIKARSSIDTMCFHYVNCVETYGTASGSSGSDHSTRIRNKCDGEVGPNGDWWLRNWSDCHVSSFPVKGPDCLETASTWRINHSELVTPDANGRRYPEWHTLLYQYDDRYDPPTNDSIVNGRDGQGIRSEDNWQGVFCDVMAATGKVGADWDGDGTDEDKEGTQVVDWVTIGHVNHVNSWRALEPTFIITGNFASNASQLPRYNLVPPRFYDLLEGPTSEFMMGESHASEEWAVDENAMMLYMKRIMTFNATSRAAGIQGYELFDSHSTTKPAGMSFTDWTRYGLCVCLQDDLWYSGKDDQILTGWPLICNEFDLNMGQPLTLPNYDTSSSGYTAYQDGVYAREFFNSSTGVGYIALFNPKNNGVQTVILPVHSGFQWNRLGTIDFPGGVDDPDVNDGVTNITTQTMDPRTGIIIKRNPASFGVVQTPTTNLPAFPGLRGFGYDTVHGSGRHLGTPATTVLYVDSLATDSSNTDSTHGSLKWCLEQTFPRVIVPAISGVIPYAADTNLEILNPYVTYAGQCAPGDGLHIHRAGLKPATKEALIWHYSGFMQDATGQGTADPIQLGTNNSTEDQVNIVVANCGAMYGMDQSMSVFNSSQSYVSDYTFWQCLIGSAIRGGISSGYATLMDNTNISPSIPKGAMLRSYMSNCYRRNPRINAGIFESSNNFVNDAAFYLEFDNNDSQVQADATEMNFRNNGFVRGAIGDNFSPILAGDFGTWFLGGYYHESGNVKESTITDPMVDNSTPTTNPPGDSMQGTPSSVANPEGLVLRYVTDSDAGLLEFHAIMDLHVGPRPNARLTVHQDEIDFAANHLNSTTPVASRLTSAPNPPTISEVSINHETTGSHGLGVIPTAGKDVVQASGYTLLEEWLHDHHAFFMPIGWDL